MSAEIMIVQIFFVLGIITPPSAIILFVVFWKRIVPAVIRVLFWASRHRYPLLLLCHDSGRSILTSIIERQGEGIVITPQGKYKILPRFAPKQPLGEMVKDIVAKKVEEHFRALEAQEQAAAQQENGQEGQPALPAIPSEPEDYLPTLNLQALDMKTVNEHFVLDYSDYVNKRSFLIGLDSTVYVGYTGKLCLLNPEALALYEAGDMMVRTNDLELFNPSKVEGKEAEKAMQPLLLLNPRKIQEIIWKGFDQSQIAGVVADAQEEERIRLAGGLSPRMKMIIMIALFAALGVAAIFFLPQLLGG